MLLTPYLPQRRQVSARGSAFGGHASLLRRRVGKLASNRCQESGRRCLYTCPGIVAAAHYVPNDAYDDRSRPATWKLNFSAESTAAIETEDFDTANICSGAQCATAQTT